MMRRPAAALMQPTFLPWLGYFALIDAADYFVLLDDFQFQRRSWHHRNRLFSGPERVEWVTIPASHSHSDSGSRDALNEVQPNLDDRDRRKLLRRISQAYAQCPHAEPTVELLEEALGRAWGSLAELNRHLIEAIADRLGVSCELVLSSELEVTGQRSERLARILETLGAGTYLAARSSADYMVADGVFPLEGVEVGFQDYRPAPYPQAQSEEFVPCLSAADALMQIGEEAGEAMRAGAHPFLSWEATVESGV